MHVEAQRAGGTKRLLALVFCLAAVAQPTAPARAAELSPGIAQLYTSVSIFPPSAARMTVCYGFVCRRRYILDFSPGDRAALTQIMNAGKASAAAERSALQQAVVWWDKRLGPILGTNKRVAKADVRAFDAAHNYDCWDTTRNTTSLLLVLAEWGLIRHHTVGDPKFRGYSILLQLPHNTAVLVDRKTNESWVLDLWPRAYAQVPDVMTVAKWVTED